MGRVVYLTSKRFNTEARSFVRELADELRRRCVEVVTGNAYDVWNYFRPHRTYGVAMAVDFFHDHGDGCSLTLNRVCPALTRDFAYNLSNHYDILTPQIRWRSFTFVDSHDRQWYRFFNRVSAEVKLIIYPATLTNEGDMDAYQNAKVDIIKVFADEILRCLRSNYNYNAYAKAAKAARIRINEIMKRNG